MCMGELTLEVNDKTYVFGRYGSDDSYDKFWTSGGSWGFDADDNEYTTRGPWIIDKKKLPEELQEYADEIGKVFNANVRHGCCGGCI